MKKGVTLLLAVFISTLALSLGLGIFTIIYGELGLSATSKESLYALYAADTGIECALYWDIKNGNFFKNPVQSTVKCGTLTPVLTIDVVQGVSTTTKFILDLQSSRSCANITVKKTNAGASDVTVVTSLGSNIACGASSAKALQRGLEVTY